jgi:beta-glucanase (GH16 family)
MKRAVTLFATLASVILLQPNAATQDAVQEDAVLNRAGLVKTFGDEFDSFDRKRWIAENFDPVDTENRIRPWTREKQFYIDASFRGLSRAPLGIDPFAVRDGVLTITANRAPSKAKRYLEGYNYTSGWISTLSSFSQTYGYFEARVRVPKGKALFPAFWLLKEEGGWPPEIDVMEVLGRETTALYVNVISEGPQGDHPQFQERHDTVDLSADFHVYGVDWGPREIVFYLDDREIHRVATPEDLHKPCYMILNLALGGEWARNPDRTTPLPSSLEIDWVRAWRRTG